MKINWRFLGTVGVVSALITACTTDNSSPDAGAGGSGSTPDGGMATGGSSAGGSGAGGSSAVSGPVCASPILITNPGIANFDNYDGVSNLATWSFPLGGDSSTGILAGPFAYGDRSNGQPETFDMVAGYNSTYALNIADTLAQQYGGGMGLWLSGCLNATKFTGISFWIRGNCPTGKATLTVSMQETTSSTPTKAGGTYGTCTGTSTTCVNPTFNFTVTDVWTQIQVPWTAFTAGSAAGTPVMPDGRNITQLQFGVGLNWVSADGGAYEPVPAPYQLTLDTLAFY